MVNMSNLPQTLCLGSLFMIPFIMGFILGYLLKTSLRYKFRVKQNKGEATVRKRIIHNYNSPKFHLLNDITLPFQDGTTQIDHILVSTKGVFVIETKNYSGWIFGNVKSKQWTQVIYQVKNKFQNPLFQNYKHLLAIQQLLDFLPKELIQPIVVFSGSAEFKSSVPKGVVYLDHLLSYLGKFDEDKISANRVEFCVGRIECNRYEATRKTDIQHQSYLSEKFNPT
jgi:hypothetical protein